MKKKLIYTTLFIALIIVRVLLLPVWDQKRDEVVSSLSPLSFQKLPGWQSGHMKQSLRAFQQSCAVILKAKPTHLAGSQHIDLKAKDWQPACKAARSFGSITNERAKAFFEHWFTPIEFYHHKPLSGLFTGYYMPSINGSLVKTRKYSVPIYSLPPNLITTHLKKLNHKYKNLRVFMRKKNNQLVPFYTRNEIDHGAIAHTTKVIAWVESEVDRLFLEIEGSGTIALSDGKQLNIGYAGENGAHYTSLAQIMIKRGILTKDNASSERIKHYMETHPQSAHTLLSQNKSFVFFQPLKNNSALGAQGTALTKGYSLAVDREWIPLGAPLWLDTKMPTRTHDKLQRLMIAQDTGGAIQGIVRGDIFFGAGEKAIKAAANMQNKGRYWLLLPKHAAKRIQQEFSYS